MMTDMASAEVIRDTFVVGLRNAHALEHQALALMDRQIEHLANYPEVERRLREHRVETEGQIERLDTILAGLDESASKVKDMALAFSGNMAALAHTFAPDEIIKNSFANYAFENFEVASYTGLKILAQQGGFQSAMPLIEQTLNEEVAMAEWVLGGLPSVMGRYLGLKSAGETASH